MTAGPGDGADAGADVHALVGAYVLDALDEAERAAVRRHLRSCPSCASDVDELAATAAQLSALSAEPPPPDVRARVLAEVRTTRQAPPVVTDLDTPRPAPRRRWRWELAAACLALVAAGTTWAVQERRVDTERDRVAAAQAERGRIESVLTAPDVRLRTGSTAAGRLSVVLSDARNAAVATLVAPPVPEPERVYQLWLMMGGQDVRSAGVLAAGVSESTVLIPDVAGAQAVAVTVEPEGGSEQPTEAPRLTVSVVA